MPEGRIDLTGRVAVVTGAGTGLGRSHALALAARGARVVVNDLGASVTGEGSTTSAADEVVATILAAGGDAVAEPSDVSTREGTRALYDAAVGAYGRVDILVLNAGFLRDGMFARSNIDDLDAVLAIHLHGPMYLAHHAFATMREQRFGRIVFTTSQSGVYGNIGQANYAAAKAGLIGLARSLAMEGGSHDVLSNVIMPSAVSRMGRELMPEVFLRTARPEHASALVTYLSSPGCLLNGQVVSAAAGLYAAIAPIEARGVHLDPYDVITAEDVARQVNAITDFTVPYQAHDLAGTFARVSDAIYAGRFRRGG